MKTTPTVVLGFYFDSETSARVLHDARRRGLRRSVLLHGPGDKSARLGGPSFDVHPWIVGIGVGMLVLVFGALVYLLFGGVSRGLNPGIAALGILACGCVVTAGVAYWFGSGVDPEILDHYRRWILPGETLIAVQVPLERAGPVLELLRSVEGSEPATFVIRRSHRFSDAAPESLPRERLTAEQFKLHAHRLAARQSVMRNPRGKYPLRDRVGRAERTIATITNDLTNVGRLDQGISLATEWLLDNVYVIRRHAADVRRNLSRGFYDVLPVLQTGNHAGEPRIYEIALELVAHTSAEIHQQDILDFILAYQEITPLNLGELWVLPLLLRLALIENLSQLATAVDERQYDHEHADLWANRILTAARRAPDYLLLAAAELAREQPNPSSYVIDRVVSQLQGEASALDTIRAWLERKLGAPLADVIQQEQRRHVADQVSIANAIGSLRELSRLDWRDIFEHLSPVDPVLATDPAGIYQHMDFGTRDRYRAAVEKVARASSTPETEVARVAVDLAGAGRGDDYRSHVGYYLVDAGRPALESRLRCEWDIGDRLRWLTLGRPTLAYLTAIGFGTAVILLGALALGERATLAATAPAILALLGLLALVPASEVAVYLINDIVTRTLPPRVLSKLSFDDGIPDEWRTLVVVPTMLGSAHTIQEDLENLEIRFLGNQDPNLHYALLADFTDAPSRELTEDAVLLDAAIEGIATLNQRYPGDYFSFFYRERTWSESEQAWLGWERKRGKIEELNRWLLGETEADGGLGDKPATSLKHIGDRTKLTDIRFVITLDADTQLPWGSARRLVATLAHPLNRPRLAPDGQTVVGGYSLIQPRMSTSLPSATASRFARLLAGPAGTDPYTMAVSDVYQDLVGEGSYHGKGIYDVAAFQRILGGRFPEATLLSHDLIEGAHVRVGLATDIELFDHFPATYRAYATRQHRWIRGDWQIADWATPRVPTADGSRAPNPLTPINRWKIVDNLRRSLVPPTAVALLVATWLLQPALAVALGVLVAAMFLLPPTIRSIDWLINQTSRPDGGLLSRTSWREMAIGWGAAIFHLLILPYQALIALDALGRVIYRRWISHRRMLEWQTSRSAHHGARDLDRQFLGQVAGISVALVIVAAALVRDTPTALPAAAPFLVFWLLVPLLLAWLDQDGTRSTADAIPAADQQFLRGIARQTWRYFDELVGPATNWLPPDNYQVALRVEVAPRTSPTNIGLWLLSTVAANDFGYLTVDQVIERSLATFESLGKLERFQGHLLNWYNVQTQAPLHPRYVSTVDSGNLLASLWALERAYEEIIARPIVGPTALRGLKDTLELVQDALATEPTPPGAIGTMSGASDLTARLAKLFDDAPSDLGEIVGRLQLAADPAHRLAELLNARPGSARETAVPTARLAPSEAELRRIGTGAAYWATQLDRQVTNWLEVVDVYLPWLSCLEEPVASASGVSKGKSRTATADAPRPAFHGNGRAPLSEAPSLHSLASDEPGLLADLLAAARSSPDCPENLATRIEDAWRHAAESLQQMNRLIGLAQDLANEMDMRFLYDPDRRLFSTGYNVDAWRLDPSYYDLLASEARLASFVAIARGDVPVDHWLTLGRPFGVVEGRPALLSWSGTMFEYLMPLLLTRSYDNSLLNAACQQTVICQIEYGDRHGVPWGISEAAFAAVDVHQIYQYQAFGVPGLGLKRGLADDLVVAPYATALALLVDWRAAVRNLKRLSRNGARGTYGYYDALDYTPGRQADGRRQIVVATYMVHHQGMTLLAIANTLHHGSMQERFHANPLVRAAEPLLFERVPAVLPIVEGADRDDAPTRRGREGEPATFARYQSVDTPVPRTHLLGNGQFSAVVTSAGGGFSRWHDVEISRWRSDPTLDNWGSFIYLRDVDQGTIWSTTYQPIGRAAARYAVTFSSDRATYERRDVGIETVTEVVVSPEDDAEIRRVTLVNRSGRLRHLEVTSYVELALAPHNADRGHPAFSKMFVETEALLDRRAILAWRKPRTPHDQPVWAGHVLILPTGSDAPWEYETDRARFLGRGRTPANPIGLTEPLANQDGAPLDPIFSLRGQITLEPGQRVQLAFVTMAGETRERVLALVERYQDLREADQAAEQAGYQAQLEPRHLRVTAEDIQHYQQLASSMLFPNARLRAAEQQLRRNRLGQSHLWAHGISGDLPIIAVTVGDRSDADLVREVLLAHTFWRLRGFKSDLVILNEEPGGYDQSLQTYLKTLVQAHAQYSGLDQPGGIFLRPIDQMPAEDVTLILTVARVVLVASRGPLVQQLSAPAESVKLPAPLAVSQRAAEEPSAPLPFLVLPYFNGIGGFTSDGKEYAIYLGPDTETPAPWVNIMANPSFGALISESGQGFAWYGNSQANRLLPWSNDAVADPPGEAIYLRDEETGVYWTPTPRPIRERDAYRVRHGQGYTIFEHNSHAIEQELVTFVPVDDAGGSPVRIQRLRLRNRSGRRRRLSATYYGEWVLGGTREETQMHVVTTWDTDSQALLARNVYHPDYAQRVAFASCSHLVSSSSGDRTTFLGRNGSHARPAAMTRRTLTGRHGAGLDPCAALQVQLELDPGQETEVTFVLGQAADIAEARRLARQFRDREQVQRTLADTRAWWDRFLGTVQVETPDLAVNFLLNRWLPYQTLSCRVWARSAFYQSGGAFGFRDQLQDVLALLYAGPQLTRQQILLAAAHQFIEGDVQHWWHPQNGAGVRTRISDDLLWLPYVTSHYIRVTGDLEILDEVVPFIEGRLLEPGEAEAFFVPTTALETGTLLDHCRRAIAKGTTAGPHGLPLIGGGDWNDGLNLVGAEGKGESVWLAWFLVDTLNGFAEVLDRLGQTAEAEEFRTRAQELTAIVEVQAWDGGWYRRAYYDDGAPLGSHENEEARIDSLPQSWAAISGAGITGHTDQALHAVEEQLVREQDRMILLFTPPFANGPRNPGYIKGYPPGVRENGGQYTHGAIWVALAFARRGEGDRAAQLLRLLNPVEHAREPADVERYRVEPYVVAADIYSLAQHVGRGGWTWYTGSSGWLYRVWLEEVLGFKPRADRLTIDPVLPSDWPTIKLTYRYQRTTYEVVVDNPDHVCHGVAWVEVNGERQSEPFISLVDDGGHHAVVVRLEASGG